MNGLHMNDTDEGRNEDRNGTNDEYLPSGTPQQARRRSPSVSLWVNAYSIASILVVSPR